MSKKKAKEKSLNKYMRKMEEEKSRKKQIETDKDALAEKTNENQERNKKQNDRRGREDFALSKEAIKKELINKKISPYVCRIASHLGDDKQLAKDFVLEEIDAAFVGNRDSKNFVINSGFEKDEYSGAMSRGIKAVEDGPQEEMNQIRIELATKYGIPYASKVLLSVVDRIMQLYALGRYRNVLNHAGVVEGAFSSGEAYKSLKGLLQSYEDFLYKPKLFGTGDLSTSFISVARGIDEPTEELSDHINFMILVSMAGKRIKTAFIPREILSIVHTDLEIVSTIDIKHWKETLHALSLVEKNQAAFFRAIELGRQVGDINDVCAINVAPAIYNAFNLLFREHPDKSELKRLADEFNLPFEDLSFVTGSVSGAVSDNKYKEWVFKHTGI